MVEPIEMLFGDRLVGPRKHVLDEVNVGRMHVVVYAAPTQSCVNSSVIIRLMLTAVLSTNAYVSTALLTNSLTQ